MTGEEVLTRLREEAPEIAWEVHAEPGGEEGAWYLLTGRREPAWASLWVTEARLREVPEAWEMTVAFIRTGLGRPEPPEVWRL